MLYDNCRKSDILKLQYWHLITNITFTKRGIITLAVEQFEHLYKETQKNNSQSHLREEAGNWVVPEKHEARWEMLLLTVLAVRDVRR